MITPSDVEHVMAYKEPAHAVNQRSIIRLQNGELLFGFNQERGKAHADSGQSCLIRSADGGRTWNESSKVVVCAFPRAVWVGVAGMTASAAWFTAMAIQKAAYVRALGQVELIFTFIASMVIFRERSSPLEIGGVVLIVAGILLLLQEQ